MSSAAPPPRLVVVCGTGGSGKTVLADALSRRLGIACLHKDAIKAALHDAGVVTPRSYEIFLTLVEQQIANGVDLIAEATFHGSDAPELLRRWQRAYDLDVVRVLCRASAATRRTRILIRPRHPAHAEADRQQLERPEPIAAYSAFPGRHVLVDTEQPLSASLEEVLAGLR
ncbi:AAA family ATPase [Amnibacterium endophyticum]|uniref:AAA family ATPase n=1 Tax=Amnibacterium endophyticum TaxID=2109337 RepID=A0ABW4LAY9_9MICO